jgi:hypothetical protein
MDEKKKIEKQIQNENKNRENRFAKPLKEEGMMNKEENKSFADVVKEVMNQCVQQHQHNHPLYRETSIHQHIIDEKRKIAAWVLFEQIDTDRCTNIENDHGWLGDEYKYSVWYMKEGKEAEQLYSDHAWIRKSISALTGSRGRDCQINLVRIEDDGIIAEISPKNGKGLAVDKIEVKITFDGKVKETENFEEMAKAKVLSIAPRLGYDYIHEFKIVDEKKNIAVIRWVCENGSKGYDVLYLAKKKEKRVEIEEIANTEYTQNYLHIKEAKIIGNEIIIDTSEGTFKRKI